uniref:Uncharacterized protein n=1 Tax=Knipowitschia caucasica TaxID=637954 RepID=A0AAV2KKD6_KNICA
MGNLWLFDSCVDRDCVCDKKRKKHSFEHRNQKLIVYNHLLHRNVLLPACPRLLVRAVRAVNDSLWFWISPFPLPFESFSSERIVHLI